MLQSLIDHFDRYLPFDEPEKHLLEGKVRQRWLNLDKRTWQIGNTPLTCEQKANDVYAVIEALFPRQAIQCF